MKKVIGFILGAILGIISGFLVLWIIKAVGILLIVNEIVQGTTATENINAVANILQLIAIFYVWIKVYKKITVIKKESEKISTSNSVN